MDIREAKEEIVERCSRLMKEPTRRRLRVGRVFTMRLMTLPGQPENRPIWIRGTRIEDEVDYQDLVEALEELRRHMVLEDLAGL